MERKNGKRKRIEFEDKNCVCGLDDDDNVEEKRGSPLNASLLKKQNSPARIGKPKWEMDFP